MADQMTLIAPADAETAAEQEPVAAPEPEARDQVLAELREPLAAPEPAPEAKAQSEPMAALHPPFTGRHTHSHSCFSRQASTGDESVEETHAHSHSHSGDSRHDHSHPQGLLMHDHGKFSGMGEIERRKVDADNEITDLTQLDALVASLLANYGDEAITAATVAAGEAWHAYACPEGIRTDDGRELLEGACQFPDLPISLRLLVEDEGGHWGAVTCGRVDTMDRHSDMTPTMIGATGVFGTDPNGILGCLLVKEQTQRFISIDPRDVEGEIVTVTVATGDDVYDGEVEQDSWLRIQRCTIGALTCVPIPAYPQACITLASVPLPDAPIANASAPPSLPSPALLVASGGPVKPKREWFANPGFHVGDSRLVLQEDGKHYACPWTLTIDGQIYGHGAYWGQEHTGAKDRYGRAVNPPRSHSGYANFLTGSGVECDDGTIVEGVGQIAMGCGHAPIGYDWRQASAFYDGNANGAIICADLRCGEDDFGIWIAGALRPGLTDEQVRQFRALSISGDWREIGGSLELVAIAAVPVPGFPIRRALAASGSSELVDFIAVRQGIKGERVTSLVAAGRVVSVAPEVRIERLEREVLELSAWRREMAISNLRASLT